MEAKENAVHLSSLDVFKGFVREVELGCESMTEDSLTVILDHHLDLEADVETRWYVFVDEDLLSHEEWPVKVVWLYDHIENDRSYSVSRFLRKVWISEGKENGVKELFPELLDSIDGKLITYDFDAFEAEIEKAVERYRKWEIIHANAKLPF